MAQRALRVDDDVYAELEKVAPMEGRSIANLASHLLREALDGRQYDIRRGEGGKAIITPVEKVNQDIFQEPQVDKRADWGA